MTLEQAIAYIQDDELVEVTPKAIRIRKRHSTRTNGSGLRGRWKRSAYLPLLLKEAMGAKRSIANADPSPAFPKREVGTDARV
jgi:hypothetical protein